MFNYWIRRLASFDLTIVKFKWIRNNTIQSLNNLLLFSLTASTLWAALSTPPFASGMWRLAPASTPWWVTSRWRPAWSWETTSSSRATPIRPSKCGISPPDNVCRHSQVKQFLNQLRFTDRIKPKLIETMHHWFLVFKKSGALTYLNCREHYCLFSFCWVSTN